MSGGKPRVLYITGMTRCGSTMLGNTLNEIPGVLHVGELHYMWRNGILGAGTNSSCGCGAGLTDCPLWSSVLASPAVPASHGDARRMLAVQDRHLRTRHTPARLAEARGSRAAPPAVVELTEAVAALYRELTAQLGVRLIVDSSKYPAEAAALLGRDDLDVRVLHMVRDPRATAFSYQSGKSYVARMTPLRSTAYWSGINAASDLVGVGAKDRYKRIRHEDFAREPRRVLDEVMRFAGAPEANPVDDEGRVRLGDNHTVTGNPDRLNRGLVTIRAGDRWRTELAWPPRAVTTAGAGLQMYHYGYAGMPSPRTPAAARKGR